MLGIAEDVANRSKLKLGERKCKVGLLMEDLSPEDRNALEHAFDQVNAERNKQQDQRVFTVAFVIDMLISNGFQVGKTVVREHIGKVCTCVNRE